MFSVNMLTPAPFSLPRTLEIDPEQLLDTTSFVLYAGGTKIALPEAKSSSIQLKNGRKIVKLEDGKIAINEKGKNIFDIFDPCTQDSAASIRVYLPCFSRCDRSVPLQWEIRALQGNGICFLAISHLSSNSHSQAVLLHKSKDGKYQIMCKSTDFPIAHEVRYDTACVTSDGSIVLIASVNKNPDFSIGNTTFRTIRASTLELLSNGLIRTSYGVSYGLDGIRKISSALSPDLEERKPSELPPPVMEEAPEPALATGELSEPMPLAAEIPPKPAPPVEAFSIEKEKKDSQSSCCFGLWHCLFGKKTMPQASLNESLVRRKSPPN